MSNSSTQEIEKSKPHIMVEILEYIPQSTLTTTIIKKATGNIMVSSLDMGEELVEKTLPFDTFIQIIDGSASVTLNNKTFTLNLGEGIVIPAHALHRLSAEVQFKMISTTIKSGYEN